MCIKGRAERKPKRRYEPLSGGPQKIPIEMAKPPARVTRSFEEFFSDTAMTRPRFWQRPFEEFEGYDEMIVLRDIRFESRCEHHMAPDHQSAGSPISEMAALSAFPSWLE